MTDWLMVALGVVLTAGTALFVAGEFSLVALDPSTVETRAAEGERRAATVRRALGRLSTLLSGAQVGITLTTILLGYTTQSTIASLLESALGSAGVAWGLATGIAAFAAAAFINVFSMLFGELVPKNLALAHPMDTARAVVPFQMAFTTVFAPVIWVLGGTANWVLRRMGIEPREEISSARSAGELAALVEHSAEEGTFDTSTASLFTNSIRMSRLCAADVMTDRGRVRTLPEGASAADVIALAASTGHSRFPVIGEDSDDVVGLVSLRRAVAVPHERRAEVPVVSSSLLAPAPSVPETAPIGPLMVQLRDEGLQMAVVVDEYGGVSGIVTLEDVIEEIVGEVSDEHDQRRLGIRPRPDGTLLVPGTLRPDELKARTGIVLPDDGPYDTLGGLIMNELGDIPAVGQRLQVDGVGLEVAQMQGRRVTQIALTPPPEPEEAG